VSIQAPETAAAREALVRQSVAAAMPYFDAACREYAYHRNQELLPLHWRCLAVDDESQ